MTGGQEFVAADIHPGGRVVEAIMGVVVVLVLVSLTFDGIPRVALLAVGCAGAVVRAVWFTGPHYLWFDGDTLVEQDNRREHRVPFAEVTTVETVFAFQKGYVLDVRSRSGRAFRVWNLNDDTEAFRHELGHRLREAKHPTLNLVSNRTLQALGLDW